MHLIPNTKYICDLKCTKYWIPNIFKVGDRGQYQCVAGNEGEESQAAASLMLGGEGHIIMILGQFEFLYNCTPEGTTSHKSIWGLFLRWLISWHIPDVPPDLHYKFSQQTLREGGWATLCITLQDIRIHNTDERLIVRKVKGPFSGPSLSLKCVASGNPPPTISWFLDGQVISVTDTRQSFTRLNTFVDRWGGEGGG